MKIKVDTRDVAKKIEHIKGRHDVGVFVATCVYRAYQEYVPREEGDLEDNVTIEPYQITHNQPYAHRMYTNDYNFRTYPHPNACSHWDERAWTVKKTTICKQIEDYINKL